LKALLGLHGHSTEALSRNSSKKDGKAASNDQNKTLPNRLSLSSLGFDYSMP